MESILLNMIKNDINNTYLPDLCHFSRSDQENVQLIVENIDQLSKRNADNLLSKIDFTNFTEDEFNDINTKIWNKLNDVNDDNSDRYKNLITLIRKCHEVNS